MAEPYHADASLKAKLRRRLVRAYKRRPARGRPLRPMISFTFDDAPSSALTTGRKILEDRGVKGAFFICAGTAGQPSALGDLAPREEIAAAAAAGHEIGCHTFSHLDCAQAGAKAIRAEIARNSEALQTWTGASPTTFAYPYGDTGFAARRALSKTFALCRGVHPGVIGQGSDLDFAPAVGIEGQDGERTAQRWMAQALARQGWLMLYTHGVTDTPSPYDTRPDSLARLVDIALADGFEVVTPAEGARRMMEAHA